VSEFNPHVVLLDLMMPGLNGFQVCKDLRASPSTKNIRVIAMTGYPSSENVAEILDAGAETCLSKPFSNELLRQQLGLIKDKAG